MPETEHRTPDGAALPELSDKHTHFVEQYFLCNMNASAAARACQYRNYREGSRLMARADIQAHIAARMSQFMTGDEVLQRLTSLARTDGAQFMRREEYEVPVFEARPLQERIDHAQAKVARMLAIDPALLKRQVEEEQGKIAGWEVELALNPGATYQKQVGTEARWRMGARAPTTSCCTTRCRSRWPISPATRRRRRCAWDCAATPPPWNCASATMASACRPARAWAAACPACTSAWPARAAACTSTAAAAAAPPCS